MIEETTIRQFYRRLNHKDYGLTELVAIDKTTKEITATGFFDNEDDFTAACRAYNQRCNVYAGRNPRPFGFAGIRNYMNIVQKKRAKYADIKHLTAVSLDIDPALPKGVPATQQQHQKAVDFALKLQNDIDGDVDDSGNGVYLWIAFVNPIVIAAENLGAVRMQCKLWQDLVKERYKAKEEGLRIDGCFDFSRIKRVIGTFNHKAQRISMFVKRSEADDRVRNEILSLDVEGHQSIMWKIALPPFVPVSYLPLKFKCLLRLDYETRKLWNNPDPLNDTSRHDWMLGMSCVEAGITDPRELAAILMNNPYGKYRRDGRGDYVRCTVGKMVDKREI